MDVVLKSPDKSVPSGSALQQFNDLICQLSEENGTDPNPGNKLEGWIKDAGFVNVNVKKSPLPMGTWAKDKHLVCIAKRFSNLF
jgi:hypothetical protein